MSLFLPYLGVAATMLGVADIGSQFFFAAVPATAALSSDSFGSDAFHNTVLQNTSGAIDFATPVRLSTAPFEHVPSPESGQRSPLNVRYDIRRDVRDSNPLAPSPTSLAWKSNETNRKAIQRGREQWCNRYRKLVDGSITYMNLPFVRDFWGTGLSLQELDQTFLVLKKTDKDYLYRAWVRHRYHIRAAEFNRRSGDAHYRSYVGSIMDGPEILALARQVQAIEKKMLLNKQGDVFAEMLKTILAHRRRVTVSYNAHRNRTHTTTVSRYHPTATEMEGGCTDRRTMPLFTLDQFLAGNAPYVSIALDKRLYGKNNLRYGDEFWIPDLDAKYQNQLERLHIDHIIFRAVDTGNGFTGKGFSRLDLCVDSASYKSRYDDGGKTIGRVKLIQVNRSVTLLPTAHGRD